MKNKLPILWQRTPRGLLERLLPVDKEFDEMNEEQGPLEIKMTEYRQKLHYYPRTVIVPPACAEAEAAILAEMRVPELKLPITHYQDKKQIRKRRKAQRKARRLARRLQKQRA